MEGACSVTSRQYILYSSVMKVDFIMLTATHTSWTFCLL